MIKTNKIARYAPKLGVSDRPLTRAGQSKPAWLYLLELRSRNSTTQSPAGRKLVVKIDLSEGQDTVAKPVKIRHKAHAA